ncbi:MAG: protoporphyrinogen/coproporphyrinogen oxidase [Nocardioidaceae bacterium]|nr:protoporphyrinogen/coproporphyrinogen oxidase [Nocardioidaceae bacterium]
MAQPARVAVVGAGMAGLACAHALLVSRPGLVVTVYEGSPVLGGKLARGEVAGRLVDLGAESMLSRRPEAVALAREVGLADRVVHPAVSGAAIWTRRSLKPLPATVMGIPVDVASAAESGLLSRDGAARAEAETRLPSLDLAADVGVGAVVAQRLGDEVRDRLVEPLLGGVYAGRSDEISLFAALPQLVGPIRELGGLLAAARAAAGGGPGDGTDAGQAPAPVFAGLVGGVGQLPEAVAADVVRRGGSVVLDARVRELARTGGVASESGVEGGSSPGWRLVMGSAAAPSVTTADVVVLATPAAPAARLLRDVAPGAARELAAIEYASVAIVTMAWESDRMPALEGTGFLVPPVDGRLVKAATFSSQKWAWMRGGTAFVRCSVGRHRDEVSLQRTDGELVEAAAAELREVVGVPATPLDARVTRWVGGLPQYAVGHLDRMSRLRSAIDAAPGIDVCGAAYGGVGIPAVIASGRQAATRVLAELDAAATIEA